MEIWKRIPEYSLYEASNTGLLKTFNWKNTGQVRIIKPALDSSGYLRTMLKHDSGKICTIKVHRIIAKTFIENIYNKPEVNHINGIKSDNRIENLEWVSREENIKHWVALGCKNKLIGEKIGTSILKEKQVLEIRSKFKKRIYTRQMLAEEYGVKACTIKDIILRNSWKHLQ